MNTINNLLDTARKACLRDSDNALSERIGVTRATVSKWRQGGAITDEHLAKLIEVAQADPALFVRVREEAAGTRAEKALWGPLWDRLSPATSRVVGVLVLCAVAGLYLIDSEAGAVASVHLMLAAAGAAAVVGMKLVRMRASHSRKHRAERAIANSGGSESAGMAGCLDGLEVHTKRECVGIP